MDYRSVLQDPSTLPRAVVAKTDKSCETKIDDRPVVVEEKGYKQTTTKRNVETSRDSDDDTENLKLPVRYAVRSMGFVELDDENVTQDKSSRTINKVINDLSDGSNVNKLAEGKELIMELDEFCLRLIDPDTGDTVFTQSIAQIRVWGIGKENGRDFAYIARNLSTSRFVCHVFKCDTPAKMIAKTLRSICKFLMREQRSQSLSKSSTSRDALSSPFDEPKRILRCHFLGITQVPKATGIEILNEAVDRLVQQVGHDRWILCDVAITPSLVSITEVGANLICECRVRHLSFLGIGRDINYSEALKASSIRKKYLAYQ
uniref:PID domain-containing protein n=1 Tax=Romanomermis culicivorax TaxID=13658 RepID=A0A915ICP6_ROMCU